MRRSGITKLREKIAKLLQLALGGSCFSATFNLIIFVQSLTFAWIYMQVKSVCYDTGQQLTRRQQCLTLTVCMTCHECCCAARKIRFICICVNKQWQLFCISALWPSCVSYKTYRPRRLNYCGKTTVSGSTVVWAGFHRAVEPFCTITATEIKAQSPGEAIGWRLQVPAHWRWSALISSAHTDSTHWLISNCVETCRSTLSEVGRFQCFFFF